MSSTKQAAADLLRRKTIGIIHGFAKRIGMEDDVRREMQKRVTGESSTAEMSQVQLEQVIAELKRIEGQPGFKFNVHQDEPKNLAKRPMLRKIAALLAGTGRPWSYVHGIAKKMFKTARVDWLRDDELHKVVAALQADANRRAEKCRTIVFEDFGQDFFEWDVDENNSVVGCRPFQAWVWCGAQVLGEIAPGAYLRIRTKLGNEIPLRHKVVSVSPTKKFDPKKQAR
jgi:phage gp16-like protein